MPLKIAKQEELRCWRATPSYRCPFCKIPITAPFDYDAAAEMWCGNIGPRRVDGSLPWCTRRLKHSHSTHIFCEIKSNQHVQLTWDDDRDRWPETDRWPPPDEEKPAAWPLSPARRAEIQQEIVEERRREFLTCLKLAKHFGALPVVARESCQFCGTVEGRAFAHRLIDRERCSERGCSRSMGHLGDHISCDPMGRKHVISIWWDGDFSFGRDPVHPNLVGFRRSAAERANGSVAAYTNEQFGEMHCCEIVGAAISDFAPGKIPLSSGRGVPPWRRSYIEKNLIREADQLRTTRGGWESGWGSAGCST